MLDEEKKTEDKDKKESAQEGGDAAENSEQPAQAAKKGKRILLILIPVILLIIAVIAYLLLFKKKDTSEEHKDKHENADVFSKENPLSQNFFLDLEDFVVDLSSQSNKPSFLKLSITLSLYKDEDRDIISDKLPIIRDNFQLYLRELRESELNGSGGMYKLKEELLIRLNKVLYPIQVKDILFREILIR